MSKKDNNFTIDSVKFMRRQRQKITEEYFNNPEKFRKKMRNIKRQRIEKTRNQKIVQIQNKEE